MNVKDIRVTFNGMEPSQALKDYLMEKLQKFEKLFSDVTSLDVVFKENIARKGVEQDFVIKMTIKVPNTTIYVKEKGADMYAMVDVISDTVKRKLQRYHDKKNYWSGSVSWRKLQDLSPEEEDSFDKYTSVALYSTDQYKVKKIKLKEWRPMYVEEAIEQMELMGFKQLLFKNIETGNCAMLYKRDDGIYRVVEPDVI